MLSYSQMAKMAKQATVAKAVDKQIITVVDGRWTLMDGEKKVVSRGTTTSKMARRQLKNELAAGTRMHGTLTVVAVDDGDGSFELYSGLFHEVIDVPRGFKGTITITW